MISEILDHIEQHRLNEYPSDSTHYRNEKV